MNWIRHKMKLNNEMLLSDYFFTDLKCVSLFVSLTSKRSFWFDFWIKLFIDGVRCGILGVIPVFHVILIYIFSHSIIPPGYFKVWIRHFYCIFRRIKSLIRFGFRIEPWPFWKAYLATHVTYLTYLCVNYSNLRK